MIQEPQKNTNVPPPALSGFSLLTQSGITIAGTTAGALLSYLFNPFLIAPRIGPEGIAVVGAFLSLFYLFAFPQVPIGNVAVRYLAELHSRHGMQAAASFIRVLFRRTAFAGALFALALGLMSPMIASYLKLQSIWPVLAAAGLAYLCFLVKIWMSALQALLRFKNIAILTIVDPAVRILTGLVFLYAGWHLAGVLGAYLFGYAAVWAGGRFFLRDVLSHKQIGVPLIRSEVIRASFPHAFYALYLVFVQSADVLAAKHYFSAFDAGLYVSAMTLAKFVFLVITPVASVGYSYMSRAVSTGKSTAVFFILSLLAAVGTCLVFAFGFYAFPEQIIALSFGERFINAAPLLPLAALSMLPVAAVIVIANYSFSHKRHHFVPLLMAGIVIHAFLLVKGSGSPVSLLMAHLQGGLIEMALAMAALLPARFGKRPQHGRIPPGKN